METPFWRWAYMRLMCCVVLQGGPRHRATHQSELPCVLQLPGVSHTSSPACRYSLLCMCEFSQGAQ